MSYMSHDAIVVTSFDRPLLQAAAEKGNELGLQIIGPSELVTNGYSSFLVCPDGSKEGWTESDAFDKLRDEFLSYLNGCRHEDGSTNLAWVAVSYSGDSDSAEITAHAWEAPALS